jgi:very-short-patch-repair endonuclease
MPNANYGRPCAAGDFMVSSSGASSRLAPIFGDFVCFESKLVIELDGDQHGSKSGLAYDLARSRRLGRDGFRIMRLSNHELNANFDAVLDGIALALGLPA